MMHTIKIENVDKANVTYLKGVCKENNCEFSLEWKSKYNSYVMYDYEPFCTEGFEINVYIGNENFCYAKFVEYLYNRRIEKIDKLNKIVHSEVRV